MRLMPSKLGYIPFGPYVVNDETVVNNLCTVLKVGINDELIKTEVKKEFSDREIDSDTAFSRLFSLNKFGENDKSEDIKEEKILQFFNENAFYIPESKQYSVPLILKTILR